MAHQTIQPLPLLEPGGQRFPNIRGRECLRAAKIIMAALLLGLILTLAAAALAPQSVSRVRAADTAAQVEGPLAARDRW